MILPLVFVLASGPQPAECVARTAARASNVWERAKAPERRRYCDLLAGASARLAGAAPDAGAALALAEEAARLEPDRAAPLVLAGRALERAGDARGALARFDAARARDERALDEAPALASYAPALAGVGRLPDAAAAYRALLPRASALPEGVRARAVLEAGLVLGAEGPGAIDASAAALREAVREATGETRALAEVALALALDRAGLADVTRPGTAAAQAPDVALGDGATRLLARLGLAHEALALRAAALAGADAQGAAASLAQYAAAAPEAAWAEHARRRAAELRRAPRPARGGRGVGGER